MIAVILSGGQSTRMGQDKGLMKLHLKTWVEIVRAKINSTPSFISINEAQQKNYLEIFEKKDLIIDKTDLQIQGPLRGLLSAHLIFPQLDILFIACDMIQMEPGIILNLIEYYQMQSPEALAFKGEYTEPLCAIYSSRGLQKILSQYNEGLLKKHSLRNVLETLHTEYLPIKLEWEPAFKNFNSAEDLN